MKKFTNNFFIRYYNFLYNYLFKKLNSIKFDLYEKHYTNKKIYNLKHSRGAGTSWLLNLKKGHTIFKKKIEANNLLNSTNYSFFDLGCGFGITLIYCVKKFDFLSYSGIDIVPLYIDYAKKNIKLAKLNTSKINVFVNDASVIILESKPYFIYFSNSFDAYILNEFLKNNVKNLILNKSVICYNNSKEIEVIKKYTSNIIYNKNYKLSVCFF